MHRIANVEPGTAANLWRVARLLALAATLALVAGLFVAPAPSLKLLWNVIIPVLPLVFLINPMLWRNVCPLATLNAFTGDRPGRPTASPDILRWFWIVGMMLLGVMVATRPMLFNTNGPVLGGTIAAVALLALGLGLWQARRAGFCNSLCPVLPVEILYGQSPLLRTPTARCGDCSLCTPSACLDLAGPKAVPQRVGPLRHGGRWVLTPYGAFAGAFPGFVVGYFAVVGAQPIPVITAYERIALLAVLSWLAVALVVLLTRVRAALGMPVLAAAAAGSYYWFSGPTLATAHGLGDGFVFWFRIVTVGFVAVWLLLALFRAPPRRWVGANPA